MFLNFFFLIFSSLFPSLFSSFSVQVNFENLRRASTAATSAVASSETHFHFADKFSFVQFSAATLLKAL